MNLKQNTVKELSELGGRIEQVQSVVVVTRSVEWKAFQALLQKDLERRMTTLCDPSLDEKATLILRGEIGYCRWMIRLAEMKEAELQALAKAARALHDRVDALHTRGHDRTNPEAEALLAEAKRLHDAVRGIQ